MAVYILLLATALGLQLLVNLDPTIYAGSPDGRMRHNCFASIHPLSRLQAVAPVEVEGRKIVCVMFRYGEDRLGLKNGGGLACTMGNCVSAYPLYLDWVPV